MVLYDHAWCGHSSVKILSDSPTGHGMDNGRAGCCTAAPNLLSSPQFDLPNRRRRCQRRTCVGLWTLSLHASSIWRLRARSPLWQNACRRCAHLPVKALPCRRCLHSVEFDDRLMHQGCSGCQGGLVVDRRFRKMPTTFARQALGQLLQALLTAAPLAALPLPSLIAPPGAGAPLPPPGITRGARFEPAADAAAGAQASIRALASAVTARCVLHVP